MNLLTIGSIFATIVQAIHAAETLFKDSPGKAKFDHVLSVAHDAIDAAVAAFPTFVADAEAIRDAVGPFINAAVGVFNAQGIFAKGSAAVDVVRDAPGVAAAAGKLVQDARALVDKIRADYPVAAGDSASLNAHAAALADALNAGNLDPQTYAAALEEAHKAGSVDQGGH